MKRRREGALEELPLPAGTRLDFLAPELAVLTVPVPQPDLPPGLTETERDIVARVYAGDSNQVIAAARRTSVRTVGNQLDAIYRKLNVASRVELVLLMRSAGPT